MNLANNGLWMENHAINYRQNSQQHLEAPHCVQPLLENAANQLTLHFNAIMDIGILTNLSLAIMSHRCQCPINVMIVSRVACVARLVNEHLKTMERVIRTLCSRNRAKAHI